MSNDETAKVLQLDVTNEIYVNLTSESAISIKKCVRVIEEKLDLLARGMYFPDEAYQFVSRYVIKN